MAALFAALVALLAAQPCFAQSAENHREAVERYLAATRTVVYTHHFMLPLAIRSAAECWAFPAIQISVDDIDAIEKFVDVSGMDEQLVQLHASYFTAEQLTEMAIFYESVAGMRIVAATFGMALPSSDRLSSSRVAAPTQADLRALEAFVRTPAGQYVKQVEAAIVAGLLSIPATFADRAVERYVLANGLSNRRLSPFARECEWTGQPTQ